MKLITIDSSRGSIIVEGETPMLNLNALIRRDFDRDKLLVALDCLNKYSEINLNNLASLCAKLNIEYAGDKCLDLLNKIVSLIKEINPNIRIVQKGLVNYFETDLEPFDIISCVEEDKVKVIKYIKDAIKLLGFIDAQILWLVKDIKNYEEKIPSDLIRHVPLKKNISDNSLIKVKRCLI